MGEGARQRAHETETETKGTANLHRTEARDGRERRGGRAQAWRAGRGGVRRGDARLTGVLRLLRNRADHVEALGHLVRLRELLRGPVRGAPVQRVALVDEPVEAAHGLLDGRQVVRAVRGDDVDVVHLEPAEDVLHALAQVLAAEADLVRPHAHVVVVVEDLARDDHVRALDPELAHGVAEHHLGRTAVGAAVRLAVVEEVDAGSVEGRDHLLDRGLVHLRGRMVEAGEHTQVQRARQRGAGVRQPGAVRRHGPPVAQRRLDAAARALLRRRTLPLDGSPNVMQPYPRALTLSPDLPNRRYSIGGGSEG